MYRYFKPKLISGDEPEYQTPNAKSSGRVMKAVLWKSNFIKRYKKIERHSKQSPS